MTVEVSKVTAYAVIRPAKDEVSVSKFTTYVVMGPAVVGGGGGNKGTLSVSLMLTR